MAKLFISYSHRDEKALERLHTHLAMLRRQGAVDTWYDRQILAGGSIDSEIDGNLADSDIFLALVSPDFLASKYCYEREMAKALERHADGSIRVIPIIVEPCDWTPSPLGKLKALPKDGKPISTWTNQNIAYVDIAKELRRIIDQPSQKTASPAAPARRESRPYRIKRDFDAIDFAEYRENVFQKIREYFRRSIEELNEIGAPIRARFESTNEYAFTCMVLNKGARNKEAHITIRGDSASTFGGDISYAFDPRAPINSANGFVRIEADEYQLYPILDRFSFSRSKDTDSHTPEGVAEALWNEFISHAGIDHD